VKRSFSRAPDILKPLLRWNIFKSTSWLNGSFLGVNIGVFWNMESRPIEWRQCRQSPLHSPMRMYQHNRPLGSIVEYWPFTLYQFYNTRCLWCSLPLCSHFFGMFDQYYHWEKWRGKINLWARNWTPVSWFQLLKLCPLLHEGPDKHWGVPAVCYLWVIRWVSIFKTRQPY
jgi:hypothetical protein